MQLPDWVTRRPLPSALVACVLTGLLLGWLATPLPQDTTIQHDKVSWKTPSTTDVQRFDDKVFQSLKRSTAWADQGKTVVGAGNVPGAPPAWSLVGVVLTPDPVALVLDAANAKVEQVAAGSALPDGATLEKIEGDAINVSSGGCSHQIELFHTSKDAETAACAPPAEATISPSDPGKHK
jgi:hypothetical protein